MALAKLPELAYVFVEGNDPGKRIGIVKRGEDGYHQTTYDRPHYAEEHVKQIIVNLNDRMGVTKAQAAAMHTASLFGNWSAPIADPDRYDENGTLRRV